DVLQTFAGHIDPRAVYDCVEPTECDYGAFHDALYIALVGKVGPSETERQLLHLVARGHGVSLSFIKANTEDPRAEAEEMLGGRATNAGGSAGYEYPLVFQHRLTHSDVPASAAFWRAACATATARSTRSSLPSPRLNSSTMRPSAIVKQRSQTPITSSSSDAT